MKVWVIDDEETVRRFMLALLTRSGHEARAFEPGNAILDALKDEGEPKPDCVVSDFEMGIHGFNGLTVLRAAKSAGVAHIVVMSASPQYQPEIEEEGGFFIAKPADSRNILAIITGS